MPTLEPAPIPLTKRKAPEKALVAAGAMLGNEIAESPGRASSVGVASLVGEPRWAQRRESDLPDNRSDSRLSLAPDVDLAHAATWRAETIEALPPPREALPPPRIAGTAAKRSGPAAPAIIPPSAARTAERSALLDQQREYPRFPGRVDLGLQSLHNFYAGFGSDIESGGLFVATCAPFELGEALLLTFTVPGFAGAWSSRGIVEYAVSVELEGQGTLPGMGLRLLDLDSRVASAINRFMRQRDPIFYEPH